MNGYCYATLLLVAAQYGSFNPTPLDELTINLSLGQTTDVTTRTEYETFDDENEDEQKTGLAPTKMLPIVVGGVDNANHQLKSSQVFRRGSGGVWRHLNHDMNTSRSSMGVAFLGPELYMAGGKGQGGVPLDSVYSRTYMKPWTPLRPLNHARMFNALTVVNLNIKEFLKLRLVVTGGRDKDNQPTKSTEIFFDELGWSDFLDMIYPRAGHAAVAFKSNRLYALGGQGEIKNTELTTEYLDSNLKWVKGPDMAESRAFHAAATLHDFMYVCGGFKQMGGLKKYLNSCERGDDGGFQDIPPMKEARSSFGMLTKNDREIWAIGGYDGNNVLDTVEKYNIRGESWAVDGARLMEPRKLFGAAGGLRFSNALIIVGGEDNLDNAYSTSRTYKSDSTTGWKPLKPDMDNPRSHMGVAFFGRNLCMAGGKGESKETLDSVYCRILSGAWKPLNPGPRLKHARMFNTLTVVKLDIDDNNQKMVVTGGRSQQNEPLKSTEIFSSVSGWGSQDGWDMNVPRFGHAAVAFKTNKLYVLGGFTKDPSGRGSYTRSTENFFSPINKWLMGPDMMEGRAFHAAATNGKFMFVCGGMKESGQGPPALPILYLNSCEYGDNLSFLNIMAPMKEKRAHFGMVAMDDEKIWAIAGFNGDNVLNTIEKYNVRTNMWEFDDYVLNPPRQFFGATTNIKFKQFMSTSRIVNDTKV